MSSIKDKDLQRYFDGELDLSMTREVHRLLQQSEKDQPRVRSLEQMRSLISEATSAEADRANLDHLWSRVRAGIAEEQPLSLAERCSFWLRRYGFAVAAATALVVVALAITLWSANRAPSDRAPVPPQSVANRNDCVIESLDVGPQAVSTIFTIEDPEESGETTVIWVTETSAEGDMP